MYRLGLPKDCLPLYDVNNISWVKIILVKFYLFLIYPLLTNRGMSVLWLRDLH